MTLTIFSRKKLAEWFWRYIPAEIFASICALLGALMGWNLSGNRVVAALCGTWGENLGYYGRISFQDIKERNAKLKNKHKKYTIIDFLKNMRNMIIEFGPAEILDSFVIRPFWMWFLPHAIGNFTAGVVLAKFAADVTFYGPTIIAYEWRKRKFKD